MSISQFNNMFPLRNHVAANAEVVILYLRSQPYLALQDALVGIVAHAIARQTRGHLIIHIDDTDPDPVKLERPAQVFDRLSPLELKPDEFLDLGQYGPYVISERRHINLYREVALHLVEQGLAYHCFCNSHYETSAEHLSHEQSMHQLCRHLTLEQVSDRLIIGSKYLIRFRKPIETTGDLELGTNTLDDFVLLRPDGTSLPYFAHVVDNHFMRVTTQVRSIGSQEMVAQETLLYQALGWDIPNLVYVPSIHDPQPQNLFEEPSINRLYSQGYFPEAVVNFLTKLIWSHPRNELVYPLSDFVQEFDKTQSLPDALTVDYKLLDSIQERYTYV